MAPAFHEQAGLVGAHARGVGWEGIKQGEKR